MKRLLFWPMICRGERRASILVVAVWVLVFFTIIAAGLYKITSSQIDLTRRIEQFTASYYAARSAYACARYERMHDATPFDSSLELAGEREFDAGGVRCVYRLSDEGSRININTVSRDVLLRLPGADDRIVEALTTEQARPFSRISDILQVEGITPELYAQWEDILTVYGSGRVNINAASADVLGVLGLDQVVIGNILAYRAGSDGVEGTADDNAFEDTGSISSVITAGGPSPERQTSLSRLQGSLSVSSEIFAVEVRTFTGDAPALQYRIVFDRLGIKQWIEQ